MIFPVILLSLCWDLCRNIHDQITTHTRALTKVISRAKWFIYYCTRQPNAEYHPNKQGVSVCCTFGKCADSCLLSVYQTFSLIFLISWMKLQIILSLCSWELQTLWNLLGIECVNLVMIRRLQKIREHCGTISAKDNWRFVLVPWRKKS